MARNETETNNQDAVDQIRKAYVQLVDEALELTVGQPVESVKKLAHATVEAQTEILEEVASSKVYPQIKAILEPNRRYIQSYSRQLENSKEIASKTWSIFTEAALAWQRIVLEAQKATINSSKVWLENAAV